VLPQHDSPQDHAQRARAIEGCRARDRQDNAVHAVSARSQEGGDAVRPPQAHPQARPIAATRPVGSARRVLASGDRSEPETNGQVVDGKSTSSEANNSVMFGGAHPEHPSSQLHGNASSIDSAQTEFFNEIGRKRSSGKSTGRYFCPSSASCCFLSSHESLRSRALIPPFHGLRETSALPLPLVGPVDRSHGRQVLMSSAWRTAMGGMVGRPDCGPPSSR